MPDQEAMTDERRSTPRTDAVIDAILEWNGQGEPAPPSTADFARELERENDMLRREWERLNKEQEHDQRVQEARKAHLAAVNRANATEREIAGLREKAQPLADFIEAYDRENGGRAKCDHVFTGTLGDVNQPRRQVTVGMLRELRKALAGEAGKKEEEL